jgi:hypothetical protein
MRKPLDPYLKAVHSFNLNGVQYVLIGLSAINYYVKSASQIFLTGDFDICIEPSAKNAWKAAVALWRQGFALFAGGTLIRRRNRKRVVQIAQGRRTIHAENPDHNVIELLLNVSGFTFEELRKEAEVFGAGKIKIPVAGLKKLLKMKEIADRPKDRLFLERFKLPERELKEPVRGLLLESVRRPWKFKRPGRNR